MKIAVYAICKNESAFVRRWMQSMAEADAVIVLDTGSTDGSASLLRSLGAQVTEESVSPWRFDTARNRALELVPEDTDLCVCTDLDEVFCSGWRALLEASWVPGSGQGTYSYVWNFNPDGSDGVCFYGEKIHTRHGWRWFHPVHEVLRWTGPGPRPPRSHVPALRLEHHADTQKSRGQYLPLLELSVAEDPEDDRNLHYLGREYLFHRRWDDCIAVLEQHLRLPGARWEPERCASMRFIARAWQAKGNVSMARRWLLRAAGEAPWLREPWVALAELELQQEHWAAAWYAANEALAIRHRDLTYISEPRCWGALPEDLAAVSGWYLGLREQALIHARRALEAAPDDDRLRENLRRMEPSPEKAGTL